MEKKKPLYLPSELVTQILVRLPVKSLMLFKCVSKSWFSLISDSNFANSHFQLATHTHRILSISRFTLKTRSIDFESSLNHKYTSLNLNWLPLSGFLEIKGSCRGFLFLRDASKLYLWNPSTGFHRQIPLSPFHSNFKPLSFLYGFGYEPSRDDYFVVSFSYDSPHLEFFSVRDNTWKVIESTGFPSWRPYHNQNPVSLINGSIHWLAFHYDLMVNVIVVVFVFDLMERKLLEIPTPDGFGHYGHYRGNIGLWVFEDFLSLWTKKDHIVEIWVMREYKVHSSWTKTHVFPINDIPYFSPIYSTKNGDIIGTNGYTKLVKYNGKGQLLGQCCYHDNLDEVVMYTESLLSLPGNIEQV